MLVDYTGDIMYPKITALLEDQSRGNGVKRGVKSQFPESTKTLKGHDLLFGSLLFLTKTAPSPRFRANPYLKYNKRNGRLVLTPELDRTANKLDQLLRGHMFNTKIQTFEVDEVE